MSINARIYNHGWHNGTIRIKATRNSRQRGVSLKVGKVCIHLSSTRALALANEIVDALEADQ